MARRRTARLRPEYAPLYPSVDVDRWHDAAVLAEAVRLQCGEPLLAGALAARVLSDIHFRFDGGIGPVPQEIQFRRAND